MKKKEKNNIRKERISYEEILVWQSLIIELGKRKRKKRRREKNKARQTKIRNNFHKQYNL